MARLRSLLKNWKRWLLALVLGIVALVVIAILLLQRAATAPTPSAFYIPPDPLPAGAPGTIIRSEPITDSLPDGAVAWRVLYLSTDDADNPIAVSGVVIAPEGADSTPRPVVAWAHGTVGVLPECGISHTSNPFNHIPEVELMVREGFVVAATDYPGHGTPGVHPYLVGPVEAHSVLDSVRAARQLDASAGDQLRRLGALAGQAPPCGRRKPLRITRPN
ncbi:MAG: lipase family protein [Anaerolineae bacterium]